MGNVSLTCSEMKAVFNNHGTQRIYVTVQYTDVVIF